MTLGLAQVTSVSPEKLPAATPAVPAISIVLALNCVSGAAITVPYGAMAVSPGAGVPAPLPAPESRIQLPALDAGPLIALFHCQTLGPISST